MGQKKKYSKRKRLIFRTKKLSKRKIQDGGPHEINDSDDEWVDKTSDNVLNESISASKITGNLSEDNDDAIQPGFILMQFICLSEYLSKFLPCPDCKCIGHLEVSVNLQAAQGFGHQVKAYCNNCESESVLFTTSKRCQHTELLTGKKLPMEANVRMVSFVRSIGKGYAALEHFSKHLNSPAPMSKSNYNNIMSLKHSAAKRVAKESMKAAADEVTLKAGTDVAVSVDGSWQRRGHVSNNGIVTVISVNTGKCLDAEIMSKGCERWKDKEDSPEYELWLLEHDCQINHTGSAGSMESAGAIRIFSRSVEQYGLRYVQYLGDGDSASYKSVVNSNPYDCDIEKLECVGHVQKRTGSRLRKLKQKEKLGGAGKLTEGKIDTLQNYFGIAIRQNVGDLVSMQQNAQATLYHVASTDDRPDHTSCPMDSWCGWHNDPNNYKHRHGLPAEIVSLIEPIYHDLCDESLLKKCLHGQTQNANECLNKVVWDHCSKNVFVGRDTLEEAVYSSVSLFMPAADGSRKTRNATQKRFSVVFAPRVR